MHTKTLAELAAGLRDGEFSSEELAKTYIERIEKHDASLNSFITVSAERALEQARAADRRIAKGEGNPLTGVPLAHKDIFCTKGVKTSAGSLMLDNFIAPYDATVVERCDAAGMVTLGKANMDEFAMGSSNENSYYGAVKNPWDKTKVPGGSSGGSAAAVAARLVPVATGTDTGGSIRQPAAFCGLTGLKPTYGRVSRWGMIAFGSSLDQAGPLAQTAEDAALLLQVIAGFDERDSTCAAHPVPDFSATLGDDIKGLKIGLPKQYFGNGLDAETAAVIQDAINEYRKLGAEIVEIDLPVSEHALSAYYIVAPAECSSNLSRMDGVRFGYRCENPVDLNDLYTRSRTEGFGAEVKRRIMVGAYALSAGYYDAYYLKAQRIRRLVRDDFLRAFEQVDVIMGPTAPDVAFGIGEKTDDPMSMYLTDIYTVAVNLAGLPGMSIPAGFAKGLPVGLQVIGPHFSEPKLLNVGHQYQQVTDWHRRAPEGI